MKLLLSFVFILTVSLHTNAQKIFKVELPTKDFTSSFIYSISSDSSDQFNLEVVNISNKKKVLEKVVQKTKSGKQFYKIDLSQLDSGSYHFILSNDQKKYKRTIIKSKS